MRSPWDDGVLPSGVTAALSLGAVRRERGSAVLRKGQGSSAGRRRIRRDNRENGFTIVEIMITVAIILTISAIAVPNFKLAIDDAKNAKAVGDIRTIEDGVQLYLVVNNALPDDLSQVGYGGFLDPWGSAEGSKARAVPPSATAQGKPDKNSFDPVQDI